MNVLIDMDGVIADFDAHARQLLADAAPEVAALLPPAHAQEHFYLADALPAQQRHHLNTITATAGFFADLPPVAGAVAALEDMQAMGWHVSLCTAPLTSNPSCASDKFAWVGRHLGRDWQRRLVVTKDKTLVRGDVLIDDKPVVTGHLTPMWTHVLYTRACNAHIEGQPRITWAHWKPVLEPLADQAGRGAA